MKNLWRAFLVAMMLTCLSVSVAMAQSEEGVEVPFCGELSEMECANLDATAAIMAGLTSGSSANQIKVYATSGALGEQELSLSVSSAFTFVIQPADLERLMTLQAVSLEELDANPRAIMDALRLPFVIDRDQTVTLAFSPELLEFLGDRLGANIPASLSFHIRIVNQVIYIRLADYDFFGGQPDWMPEWIGIETRVLLSDSVASAVTSQDFNVEDVQRMLVPPGAQLAGSIVYHVPPEQVTAYADFMNLSSRGLGEQAGSAVTNYRLTWDIARYLGGPLFAEHAGTHEFPSTTSRLYGSTAVILLDGLESSMNQAVSVEDSYVYSVNTEVRWAMGIPGGPPLAERPTLGMSISMQNSNLNSVEAIPAPEGAFVPPINFILAIIRLFQR